MAVAVAVAVQGVVVFVDDSCVYRTDVFRPAHRMLSLSPPYPSDPTP